MFASKRDRQPSPQANHCTGHHVNTARQRLFNLCHGLLRFAIAEARRKFNRSRLHSIARLSCQHIRKGRRSTTVEIIGWPHEEIEIALERTGLRQR